MRNTIAGLFGAAALFVVIGAGCNATTEPTQTGTTPSTGSDYTSAPTGGTSTETTPTTGTQTGDLTLSAEAMGNMEVKLSWTTGRTLNESNRFILVRGMDENPSHDGKHDWIRQYHAVREVIWKQNKTGPAHFRVCLTENNEKDTCVLYSNDVTVEVR